MYRIMCTCPTNFCAFLEVVGESCENHERTVYRIVCTCLTNFCAFLEVVGELCENCERTMYRIVCTCPTLVKLKILFLFCSRSKVMATV